MDYKVLVVIKLGYEIIFFKLIMLIFIYLKFNLFYEVDNEIFPFLE